MNGGEESAVVLAFATPTSRDKDAVVEALFREHFGSMVRLAYCLLGDRAAAEDVAQEAFVALHLHRGTCETGARCCPTSGPWCSTSAGPGSGGSSEVGGR